MHELLKRATQKERWPGEERITSAARIRWLLHSLHTEHTLLRASVPGCSDKANTAILGINDRNALIYLDELSSSPAHTALLHSGEVDIDCRFRGMKLAFTTHLLQTAADRGPALYTVALPRVLSYLERRKSYRLRLGPGLTVPLTVPDLAGEAAAGEAFDLSATGMGAVLHTRRIAERGQILRGVTLYLGRSRPLRCTLDVRYARHDGTPPALRIGARFVALDHPQERRLARFLAEQQRKRRRHGSR